jgi:threonine/homoserine/homoserine lactone efflux protein
MHLNWDIFFFLTSVVLISLSGVIMPGPLFAVTASLGYKNKNSGYFVGIGQGLVEIPLMILIYLGFSRIFTSDFIRIAISFIGGLMLIYMGVDMFSRRKASLTPVLEKRDSPLLAGAVTTLINPYFILWWVTIGATLILTTRKFGIVGFILFAIVHWLCDFIWCSFISLAAFKSKRLWSGKVQEIVISACALILLGFGGWFIYNAVT